MSRFQKFMLYMVFATDILRGCGSILETITSPNREACQALGGRIVNAHCVRIIEVKATGSTHE